MSRKTIKKAVEDAGESGIRYVAISGGEPFSKDNLYYAVSEATENGMVVGGMVTSAYFAKDKESAMKVFGRLKDAGYSTDSYRDRHLGVDCMRDPHIRMSMDMYHKEFVPLKHVMNAADAYYEVFGKNDGLVLDYVTMRKDIRIAHLFSVALENSFKQMGIMRPGSAAKFNGKDIYEYWTSRGRVMFRVGPMVYAGRARRFGKKNFNPMSVEKMIKQSGGEMMPCFGMSDLADSITVESDGSVYLCCSNSSENLNVGDIKKESFKEIIEKVNGDELLNLMMVLSPLEVAHKNMKGILKVDSGFAKMELTNACEVCEYMFSDENIHTVIEDYAKENIVKTKEIQKKIHDKLIKINKGRRK
jgi:MoaA/NifB/PqqE/SkfB family radical SAM enzyme